MNARRTLTVSTLVVLAGLLAVVPGAHADEAITSTGPVEKLWVGDDLACQVSYQAGDTYEFYPPSVTPGDCGTFVALDGTLYAPDFTAHGTGDQTATGNLGNYTPLTPVSEQISGDGSAANPFAVTTEASAAGKLTVQQTIRYVTGQSKFSVDVTVRNPGNGTMTPRLYFAGDCYASGSDIGYGFRRPEIKSIGCSQNPDNAPAARTIQLLPSSPGSRGVEDKFGNVWARIGNLEAFDDTCLCTTSVDNGVGVEWQISLAPGAAVTRSLDVAFTESTPPAPPADSDGDAIPDIWETGGGAGSDAENLAPLGADPNRKDLFVHADWMEGCKPPVGWETRAIDMFAGKGIALHVDSGPDSLNFDKQPWGTRSRAGAVPYSPNLDIRQSWASLDALKDAQFVASKRRRAFYYVLFADRIQTPGDKDPSHMGIARGIPDSDLIIANCGQIPRADTTYFVHELGHLLGLRHGGFEDLPQFKPNHYSVMNYAWARYALEDDRRFFTYSSQVPPTIDENRVNEQHGLQGPAVWDCPDGTPRRSLRTTWLNNLDLDCDGTAGEKSVKANLNGDTTAGHKWFFFPADVPLYSTLAGFNDWNAIKFGGGGIVGSLTLPQRTETTPPVGEFTEPERAAEQAREKKAVEVQAKQLRIVAKAVQLRKPKRKRARTTLRIQVTDGTARPIRRASVRVKGGTLAKNRKRRRTDRKGYVTLKLKLRSRKQLQIIADRGGYRRAVLILPVVRR